MRDILYLQLLTAQRIGEVLNLFANAAHAPQMSMRIDARLFNYIPGALKQGLLMLPPVRRIYRQVLKDLGAGFSQLAEPELVEAQLIYANAAKRAGDLDTAIAIRTMFVTGDGKVASLQAGAGIVADSVPDDEDLECRNKAAALLAAIPAARRMTSARRAAGTPA